ncbi:short-chain dehydrogenase [Actinoplanes sp. OR16]|uniref:SDR family NAD(P)-dependent oxidoreductase n=1 Tax=Actinoplanes sp. OR16 TaxID=946334 RepID=UPI000F6C9DDB|nr:SDR family oxidoreductase [Actinoplanes sp. OR16]BBH69443.1 short-chain dehydrogenase [Actinoplanes sp. OR16]
MRSYRGTHVLITGASSGLGAEFAAQFASRGADVVLVARREDRLRELAARLQRDHKITATPLALDLSQADAPAKLRTMLDGQRIRIQSLINNAGFGAKGPFADEDPARIQQMISLNVNVLVGLTREFLPDLVTAGSGVIVNVASTAAYQPCPQMAVYGATKAFVLSFTEALAYETRTSGLAVTTVSPGPTSTEFFDVVGTKDAAVGRFETAHQVVSRTMRELDRSRPRPSFVSGPLNTVTSAMATIMPRRVTLAVSGRALR